MKPAILVLLAFISLTNGQILFGQDESYFQNSQIAEIGGLYGQLIWKVLPNPPFQQASEFNRTQLIIFPTARLTFHFVIGEEFLISPFLGYSRLGGRSEKMASGYEDEFKIDALQLGTFFGFHYDIFEIALGAEVNYHFEKRQRSFTSSSSGTFQWQESDEEIFLRDLSMDVGLRFVTNFDHILVAGEAWFGVSPMQKSDLSSMLSIRQNNFRVLVGYRMY